jgi:hypothetical protein
MEKTSTQIPRYIRNPDVVLREEDQDGALLFNPDTNQVKVINNTALFVWQQCDGKADLVTIVAAMQDAFDEVPEQQVTGQVQAFLDEMSAGGFIGTVETQSI